MRILLRIGFAVLAVAVFGTAARPAQADPHALFYTAVGQQQLFFNVLAALDQADYVEPAEGQSSREELLNRRAEADPNNPNDASLEVSTNPASEKTKTDLAAVLTRGVTLEGHDLWTSYVIFQQALEVKRRDNLKPLIDAYCNIGLGKCEGENVEAFRVDPSEPKRSILGGGILGVLFSGTADDQQIRREELIKQARGENIDPRTYDRGIAELRQQTVSDPQKKIAAEQAINSALRTFISSEVATNVFGNVSLNSDGEVSFVSTSINQPAGNKIVDYLAATSNMAGLSGSIVRAASQGANEVSDFLDLEQSAGGDLAESQVVPEIVEGTGSVSGVNSLGGIPTAQAQTNSPLIERLPSKITSPNAVRSESRGAGQTVIGVAESNNKYALEQHDQTQEGVVSGIQIVTTGAPGCFVRQDEGGEDQFFLQFQVANVGGQPRTGVVTLQSLQTIQGTRVAIQNPSVSPPASSDGNNRWDWNGQIIGNRTYELKGTVRNEAPDVITFQMLFRSGDPRRSDYVNIEKSVDIVNCLQGDGTQNGNDTSPPGNPVSVTNDQSQVAGTISAGQVAAATSGSFGRTGLADPNINPAPVHTEPGFADFIEALRGRGRLAGSLFAQAVNRTGGNP